MTSAVDLAVEATDVVDAINPRDVDDNPIHLGDKVHYVHDRTSVDHESPWTPERWGIVTGVSRLHDSPVRVQVTPVRVYDNVSPSWTYEHEWYTEPESLRVIG